MDTETTPVISDLEHHWHRHGITRIAEYSGRLDTLVRSLDDEALHAPVPGLQWTAIDVVAHLASVWRRYTVNRERATTWEGIAIANESDRLAMGRDVTALLADIEQQMVLMAAAPDLIAPSARLPFHAGQTLSLAGAWGNALNELLVHGDDIARATGTTWTFDDADVEPLWRYTSAALPGFLTPHGRAASDRWLLDFSFASGPVRLRFDSGAIHVDEADEAPSDYTVTGRAAEATLGMVWHRREAASPAITEFARRIAPV